MIKLIFCDMDGTLLNDDGKLPPDFEDVLAQLKEKGVLFAAASGRQYAGLTNVFPKHKNDMFFIAENGAYMVHHDKELYSNVINRESAFKVIETAKKIPHTAIMVSGKTAAYITNTTSKFFEEVNMYCGSIKILQDFSEIPEDIIKVAIFSPSGRADLLAKEFSAYGDTFKIVISSKFWVDVIDPDVNKGIAVKRAQEYFNITPEETLVFGDYLNDLEMMSSAKYSYAMKNAHPGILKAANFVTQKTNNEYGVTATIKELFKLN